MPSWPTGIETIKELIVAGNLQKVAPSLEAAHDFLALPRPLADLVSADQTALYPTNFAAMPADALTTIATRGEQLMRLLLPYYCPELLAFK